MNILSEEKDLHTISIFEDSWIMAHLTLCNMDWDFLHGFSKISAYMHSIKLDMPTFNFTQDLQDSFKYGINTT